MNSEQLLLFEDDVDEVARLKKQVRELRETQEKVRKGMFARHGELAKKFLELHEEVEGLRKYIIAAKPVRRRVL